MKGKILLAILLCMAMCITMFPTWAFADEELPDTEQYEQMEEVIEGEEVTETVPEEQEEKPAEELVEEAEKDIFEEQPAIDSVEDNTTEDGPATQDEENTEETAQCVDNNSYQAKVEKDLSVSEETISPEKKMAEVGGDEEEESADLLSTIANGECGAEGDNLTWTLDDAGTLTISGTGAMTDYAYTIRTAPWLDNYRSFISEVIIEPGLTHIGYYAFYNCTNLINITIPEGVTGIGEDRKSTCKPPSSVTPGPSAMSVPRPAMFVAIVTLSL